MSASVMSTLDRLTLTVVLLLGATPFLALAASGI
jgi:hypothetical protein